MPTHQLLRQVKAKSLSVKIPWNALWFKRSEPLKKHHFSLVGVQAGSARRPDGHHSKMPDRKSDAHKPRCGSKRSGVGKIVQGRVRRARRWPFEVSIFRSGKNCHALRDGLASQQVRTARARGANRSVLSATAARE